MLREIQVERGDAGDCDQPGVEVQHGGDKAGPNRGGKAEVCDPLTSAEQVETFLATSVTEEGGGRRHYYPLPTDGSRGGI